MLSEGEEEGGQRACLRGVNKRRGVRNPPRSTLFDALSAGQAASHICAGSGDTVAVQSNHSESLCCQCTSCSSCLKGLGLDLSNGQSGHGQRNREHASMCMVKLLSRASACRGWPAACAASLCIYLCPTVSLLTMRCACMQRGVLPVPFASESKRRQLHHG